MNSKALRTILTDKALKYAQKHVLGYDDSYSSALIFTPIEGNFHNKSYDSILNNPDWITRLNKDHTQVKNAKEMQSSNSSDALLMNIFCHPEINKWAGVKKLLGVEGVIPNFGEKPGVPLKSGNGDNTEIDMTIGNVYFEAKLTEKDFTQRELTRVHRYAEFETLFYVDDLNMKGDEYDNYQIIRNLLAAINDHKRHILLCDERRPDLDFTSRQCLA